MSCTLKIPQSSTFPKHWNMETILHNNVTTISQLLPFILTMFLFFLLAAEIHDNCDKNNEVKNNIRKFGCCHNSGEDFIQNSVRHLILCNRFQGRDVRRIDPVIDPAKIFQLFLFLLIWERKILLRSAHVKHWRKYNRWHQQA